MDTVVDVVLNTVEETHLLEVIGNLDHQILVFDVQKIRHLYRTVQIENIKDLKSIKTNKFTSNLAPKRPHLISSLRNLRFILIQVQL